jgi:dCMP deaminase
MLINSGVRRVVYLDGYTDPLTEQMLSEAGVVLVRKEERDP